LRSRSVVFAQIAKRSDAARRHSTGDVICFSGAIGRAGIHESSNRREQRVKTFRASRIRGAVLYAVATTAILGAMLAACAKDDAGGVPRDSAATNAATNGAATEATDGAADTAAAATGGDSAVVPPPPADEVRRQMKEKFDIMGGMEHVRIDATSDGVVQLSGTVSSADRRQTAEDVARAIPGVVRVDNRIRVE
jgi:hypothetical protein